MDDGLAEVLEEFCTLNEFSGKAGTSASARVGGKQDARRQVAVVGVGPAAKAKAVADWGASPFQVGGFSLFGASYSING